MNLVYYLQNLKKLRLNFTSLIYIIYIHFNFIFIFSLQCVDIIFIILIIILFVLFNLNLKYMQIGRSVFKHIQKLKGILK